MTIRHIKNDEAKIQSSCFIWLWNNYPTARGNFILIDNNSSSLVGGMQKKAMGLNTGAADTLLFWKGIVYFIEFKTPTGIQSDAQRKFEAKVNEHSLIYLVVDSFNAFQLIIKAIMG